MSTQKFHTEGKGLALFSIRDSTCPIREPRYERPVPTGEDLAPCGPTELISLG